MVFSGAFLFFHIMKKSKSSLFQYKYVKCLLMHSLINALFLVSVGTGEHSLTFMTTLLASRRESQILTFPTSTSSWRNIRNVPTILKFTTYVYMFDNQMHSNKYCIQGEFHPVLFLPFYTSKLIWPV